MVALAANERLSPTEASKRLFGDAPVPRQRKFNRSFRAWAFFVEEPVSEHNSGALAGRRPLPLLQHQAVFHEELPRIQRVTDQGIPIPETQRFMHFPSDNPHRRITPFASRSNEFSDRIGADLLSVRILLHISYSKLAILPKASLI